MKKSLLALAVLGAFATAAQAQTNVSIGGFLQAGIKSYKISSTARTAENEFRIDDDWSSRFWLTGTEDLGGGLSALFYIENRFNTDQPSTGTGNGLGNGDTFLGLKGSWGQVTLGKHTMMSAQGFLTEGIAAKGVSAIPTSMLGTYFLDQAGGYLDITRRNNSIVYRSPNMSGFSGVVGVAASGSNGDEGKISGAADYSEGRELYLQGQYANGPLLVALAYRNNRVEGRSGIDDNQWRAYGYYKLPMGLKLGLAIDRNRAKNTGASVAARAGGALGSSASRTAWMIPISYTFGNNALLFNFAKAGDLGGANNTGAKMWTLGWDHALSARTNVGVFYNRLDNDTAAAYQPFLAGTTLTGSAPAAGETASTFAVSIKHTF